MEARHCSTETTRLGGGEEVKQEVKHGVEVTPQVTVASVETQDTSAFTRLLQVNVPSKAEL